MTMATTLLIIVYSNCIGASSTRTATYTTLLMTLPTAVSTSFKVSKILVPSSALSNNPDSAVTSGSAADDIASNAALPIENTRRNVLTIGVSATDSSCDSVPKMVLIMFWNPSALLCALSPNTSPKA